VNLDGDNLINPELPAVVAWHFRNGCSMLHWADGEGTCGRIACRRQDFHMLRGYDEDCYPMGAQDVDLVLRLKALPGAKGCKVVGGAFSTAIPNTLQEKVKCCSPGYGKLRWGRMDTFNRCLFKLRRDAGQLVRNLEVKQIGVEVWRADG